MDLMKFLMDNQQLAWQVFDAFWKLCGAAALLWTTFQHMQIKKVSETAATTTEEKKTEGQ